MASSKNITTRYLVQYFFRKEEWQKREEYDKLDFEAYVLRDLVMDLEREDLKEFLEDIFKEHKERLSLIFPLEEEGSIIFMSFKWLHSAPFVVIKRITKILMEIHNSACHNRYPNSKRILSNLHGVFDEYSIDLPYEYLRNHILNPDIDKFVRLQLLILKAKHQRSPNEQFWNYIEQKAEDSELIFLPALLELTLNSSGEEGLEKALQFLSLMDQRFEKNLDLTPYFRYYIEEILYRIYSMPRFGELFLAANQLESKLSNFSNSAAKLVESVKKEPALQRIIKEHPDSENLDEMTEAKFEEISLKLQKGFGFH